MKELLAVVYNEALPKSVRYAASREIQLLEGRPLWPESDNEDALQEAMDIYSDYDDAPDCEFVRNQRRLRGE